MRALPGITSVLVALTARARRRQWRRRPRAPPRRTAAPRQRRPWRRPGTRAGRRAFPALARSSRSPPARAASANRRSRSISRSGLRDLGLKVGILDADIYGPSLPKLLGHPRAPADRRRHAIKADRAPRHAGDVDRLPGRGRDADDLARADGDVGADADAARGRVGHARRHGGRHAARHRRRAADHGADRCRSKARSSSRRRRISR